MREDDGELRHHARTLKALNSLRSPLGLLLENLQLGKRPSQGSRPLVHELRHPHAVQNQTRNKNGRKHEPVPVLGDEALEAPRVEIGVGARPRVAKKLVDGTVVGRNAPVDAVGPRGLQGEKRLRHGPRHPRVRHLRGRHGPGRIERGRSGADFARTVLSVDHLEFARMLGMTLEPLLKKTQSQKRHVGRAVKQMSRRRLHGVVVTQIKRFAEKTVHLETLLHHFSIGYKQSCKCRGRRGGEHAALNVLQGLDVRAIGGRHDRRAVAVIRIGIGERNGRDERLDAFIRKPPVKTRTREKDIHLAAPDRVSELSERKMRHPNAIFSKVLPERRYRRRHDLLVGCRTHILHNRYSHRSFYIDGRRRESMGGHSHERRVNGIAAIGLRRRHAGKKVRRHQKKSGQSTDASLGKDCLTISE